MNTVNNIKIETGRDNKILRTVSANVKSLAVKTPHLNLPFSSLVKEMKKRLDAEKGLGLAAPQVGENMRICLCRLNHGTDNEILFAMVNPEITYKSWNEEVKVFSNLKNPKKIVVPEGAVIGEEGCLSLPGYYVNIIRAKNVTVKFLDGKVLLKGGKVPKKSSNDGGKLNLPQITLNLSGLNARVIQHEIDHLNGVLICDRAT